MSKILFVCSANKDRSKTADDYFSEKYPEIEFLSGGTNHKICNQLGTEPVTEEMVDWADVVIVMETKHRDLILNNTEGNYASKIQVMNIRDVYKYGQKELINLLEEKAGPLVRKYV